MSHLQKLKIFISHSSADSQFAEKLFEFLRDCNCDPWLDTRSLLPGARWEPVIEEELASTDMILLVLSAGAVAKEGFLRREIRGALRIADEKRDDVPFLIPIRIEELPLPHALSAFNWLDTAALDFNEKLLRALASRASFLGRVSPTHKPRNWAIPAEHIGPLRPRLPENIVTALDLPAIVSIARRQHPTHPRFGDLDRIFERWWRSNHRCFEFIVTTAKGSVRRIGFTCILPLMRTTYQKYSSGSLSEWDLGLPDHPLARALSRFLVIQSIELESEYHKKLAGDTAWFHTLSRHLASFNGLPVQSGVELVADGNHIGEYLLTRAGFRKIASPESGGTADPRPLFQLKFKQSNPTASERHTIQVLDRYMQAYAAAGIQ